MYREGTGYNTADTFLPTPLLGRGAWFIFQFFRVMYPIFHCNVEDQEIALRQCSLGDVFRRETGNRLRNNMVGNFQQKNIPMVISHGIPAVPRNRKLSEYRWEPFHGRENNSEFRSVKQK